METENDSGKCFQKNRRPSADDNCDFSVGKKYRTSIGVVTIIKNEAGLVYINDGMSKGSVAICIDDFKNLSPVSFEDSYDIEDELAKDKVDEYPVEDELESELSDKKDSGLIIPNSISNFGELVDDVKKLDIKSDESANECTQASAIAPVFGGFYAKYKKKNGGIFQLFADTEDILDDKCGAIEKDEDFDRFVDFGRSNSSKNESVGAVEEKVDEDIDSVSADTKDAIEKYKKRKEEPEGEYIEVIRDQFSKDIKSLMKDAIKEVVRELKDENVKSEETNDAPVDEDEYSFNEGDLESDEPIDEEGEDEIVKGEDSDSSEENEKEKDAEQDEDEETDSDEEGSGEESSDDLAKELILNNDLEIDKNDSDEGEEESDDSDFDDVSDENENVDHGKPDIEIDEELFTRFKDLMKDMISSIMDEQKGNLNGIDEKRRIPED